MAGGTLGDAKPLLRRQSGARATPGGAVGTRLGPPAAEREFPHLGMRSPQRPFPPRVGGLPANQRASQLSSRLPVALRGVTFSFNQ